MIFQKTISLLLLQFYQGENVLKSVVYLPEACLQTSITPCGFTDLVEWETPATHTKRLT
jgi:hypothetical protein